MLTPEQHKHFSALLWRLREKYPDRYYIQIIEDAKAFSRPYVEGPISDVTAYECLKQYANKD